MSEDLLADALDAVQAAQVSNAMTTDYLTRAEDALMAERAARLPYVTPRPAIAVAAVGGVCTHMESAPYSANVDKVVAAVKDLRLTQIRSRIYKGNTAQRDAMTTIARAGGALFTSNLGQPGQAATPAAMVAWLETFPQGVVGMIEGNNEPNLQLGADWVKLTRQWMADLAAALKASKLAWVRGLPLLAPALGKRTGYDQLGSLPMCDYGNLHIYQGGGQADFRLDENLKDVAAVTGAKPVIVTETGYHNAMHNTSTHIATSEKAAGVYAPKVFLENALREVAGAYFYELTDNPPNPDGTDSEAHFGLLRADWTPKPAYTGLKVLAATIGDTEPARSLAAVKMAVTGPDDLAWMLLARSDGRHHVVLWRRVEVWDRTAQQDLAVTPAAVTVTFGKPATMAGSTVRAGAAINRKIAEDVHVLTVSLS